MHRVFHAGVELGDRQVHEPARHLGDQLRELQALLQLLVDALAVERAGDDLRHHPHLRLRGRARADEDHRTDHVAGDDQRTEDRLFRPQVTKEGAFDAGRGQIAEIAHDDLVAGQHLREEPGDLLPQYLSRLPKRALGRRVTEAMRDPSARLVRREHRHEAALEVAGLHHGMQCADDGAIHPARRKIDEAPRNFRHDLREPPPRLQRCLGFPLRWLGAHAAPSRRDPHTSEEPVLDQPPASISVAASVPASEGDSTTHSDRHIGSTILLSASAAGL